MNLNGQVMLPNVFPSMFPPAKGGDCNCADGGKRFGRLASGIYAATGGKLSRIGGVNSIPLMAAISLGSGVDNQPSFEDDDDETAAAECCKKFQEIYAKWIKDNNKTCTLENKLLAWKAVQLDADYIAVSTGCSEIGISGADCVAGTTCK